MVKTPINVLLTGIGELKENALVSEVVTDSRKAVHGTIFVCIKGERADGHDFAKTAIQQGAHCVLSQKPLPDISEDKIIIISDPLDAMIKIGENYKNQFSLTLAAITGSVGKTTTKEFCAAIFESFASTVKTIGNQNNEIGMPNTLFRIDNETKFAVVEMGMQGLGEIEKLSLAAKPNGAIITCISEAHLEQLKTKQNILKAKLEICKGLKQGAPLILNGDDDMLCKAKLPLNVKPVYFAIYNKNAQIIAKNIKGEKHGTHFTICDENKNEYNVFIPALGEHNVLNALSAFALAKELGLNAKKAASALSNFKTSGQRQNLVEFNGVFVFEDCYNASPNSMKAALQTFKNYEVSGKKIAVLGDMFELGAQSEKLHENVADLCAENKVDLLIAIGDSMRATYKKANALGLNCKHFLQKGEALSTIANEVNVGDAVLFKASNGMKFSELLTQFYEIKSEGEQ